MSSFRWKNFGQHLLTLVLPKWPNPSKNGLKIGRNHDMSKWPGGFVVLRYRDPIFGPDGVQGVCSTLPKPLVHIYNTRGEIEFWILREIGILGNFEVNLGIYIKKRIFQWDLTTRYSVCGRNAESILIVWGHVGVCLMGFDQIDTFRPLPASGKSGFKGIFEVNFGIYIKKLIFNEIHDIKPVDATRS